MNHETHAPEVRIIIVTGKRLWQAYCACGWRSDALLLKGATRAADAHRG